MDHMALAKEIDQIARLTGHFLLRSGQTSSEYFDKYRFESNPKLLAQIAAQMAPMIPKNTEVLAGLEVGGIPIATALSLHTGLPQVFVRKKAKDYGTCQFAEGCEIKGRQVCIIEDVITTGGQVLISAEDLRKSGAKIDHALCVIFRGKLSLEDFAEQNKIRVKPLFTATDLAKASGRS